VRAVQGTYGGGADAFIARVFDTTATAPVSLLTVTSKSGQNVLEWFNPVAPFARTILRVRTDGTFPTSVVDGAPVTSQTGGGVGVRDSFVHSGLINGTTYYYSAFTDNGAGLFSAAQNVKGTPFDTSGAVQWAYNSGSTSMAPAGIIAQGSGQLDGSVLVGANDGRMHAMNRGDGAIGGLWPGGWTPPMFLQPVQHRPAIVHTAVVPGAARVAFLGSQDGFVYAINADTGGILWGTDLGAMIQAAPAALLTAFGGAFDRIIVGTRAGGGQNKLYSLDAATGAIAGFFDNGGGANDIGIISAGVALDYSTSRAYFTSRTSGSPNSLWCVEITAGAPVACSGGWAHQPRGGAAGIDAGPVLRNGRLYVGDNNGDVHAIDPATGASLWVTPFTTTDGPVKGFVFPDPFGPRFFFATTGNVWGIRDDGGAAALLFVPAAVANASIALYPPGGSSVLVGGSTSGGPPWKLYEVPIGGGPLRSVTLGDGLGATGSPSYDTAYNMVYVGTDAGVIYAVQLPIP
jgi:outer membrane protein assembly factor BamB